MPYRFVKPALAAVATVGLLSGLAEAATVSYKVSIPMPSSHRFHLEVDVQDSGGPQLDLSMPVWSTGFYSVQDFAGQVSEFKALDGSGQSLDWEKVDKNTWRIQTGGASSVKASYIVYARSPAIVRSFVNGRTGHILGSNLFMFLDGELDKPVSLEMNLPQGWKVSNGAIPAEAGPPTRFTFESYHELIDTPMLIGQHKEYTYEVGGVPHVVAIEGESDMSHQEFVEGTRKLAGAASGFFGGLPYEKYCFILFLSPQMGGGLEHTNGTTMGNRPWGFTQDPKRMQRLLDLTSHEYFHTWNVKRLQPHLFKPYDYDRESLTGFLWFSEGVTEYYTPRLLLRADIYTPEIVLENLANLITEARNTPGRLYKSAYDSSFDTWIVPWQDENRVNTYFSYYPKGQFAGLIIDMEIMKRTGARKNFDDVVLDMWEAYVKEDAGFDTETVRKLCEKVAGGSFEEIFADYVYGEKEVPFEDYLQLAGYQLLPDTVKMKKEQKGSYLGARYAEKEGKVRLTHVLRDTEAWRDGLNYDDEIIAFGGIRIHTTGDLDLQLENKKPNDEVAFLVGREGRVEAVSVTMEKYPVPIYKIVEVEEPTALQLQIREKWYKIGREEQ